MILTCPACQSQYSIPDGSITGEGRTVKCSQCAHKWYQKSDQASVLDTNEQDISPQNNEAVNFDQELKDADIRFAESEEQGDENETNVQSLKGDQKSLTLKGVLLSFLVFFVLIMAVLTTGRQFFVKKWQPMAAFYDVIGLPVAVAGEGLAIENLQAEIYKNADDQFFLIVQGRIDNISDKEIALPILKVTSYNKDNHLKDWLIPLGDKIMQQGQSVAFDYKLDDVPQEHKKVTVTFTY